MSLQKSYYPQRPMTYYFRYPKEVVDIYIRKGMYLGSNAPTEEECEDCVLGITLRQKSPSQVVRPEFNKYIKKHSMPIGKIGKVYVGLRNILKQNGFTLTKSSNFNLAWGYCGQKDHVKSFERYQKFSHFPGCWQIGRKDNLWMNLSKKQRAIPEYYNFLPKTYCLKADYDAFIKGTNLFSF